MRTPKRTKQHWSVILSRFGACPSARRWARRQPSLLAAWRACPYSPWMAWYLSWSKGRQPHSGAESSCIACRCAQLTPTEIRRRYSTPPPLTRSGGPRGEAR